MEELVERAERIHSGGVDPSEDNFLKITNDARLLGTDARLLYPEALENVTGTDICHFLKKVHQLRQVHELIEAVPETEAVAFYR